MGSWRARCLGRKKPKGCVCVCVCSGPNWLQSSHNHYFGRTPDRQLVDHACQTRFDTSMDLHDSVAGFPASVSTKDPPSPRVLSLHVALLSGRKCLVTNLCGTTPIYELRRHGPGTCRRYRCFGSYLKATSVGVKNYEILDS